MFKITTITLEIEKRKVYKGFNLKEIMKEVKF